MGSSKEKVQTALIPYFGGELPRKAKEEALRRLEKGGKLYILNIVDEAPARSVRYRTGQIGENSEIVKAIKETQEKVQEKDSEAVKDEVREEAAKHGISIESLTVTGDPAEEVLRAIEKNSIELVLVEKLRKRMSEILYGDEISYLCDHSPCKVLTVSD